MTDSTTPTSADTQTSPFAEQFTRCRRTGCTWTFTAGSGYVPDLETLYWRIREGGVQSTRPLTRSEVLSQEICGRCRTRTGGPTYATRDTLALMATWSARNAARRERFLARQEAFFERQRARNLAEAIRREDRHPMNQLFEKYGKPKPAGHKHGRRRSRSGRRDVAAITSEPTKGTGDTKKGGR